MRCIAHRGFAGVEPENTLSSVLSAANSVDSVEIDVRRCGSGDLVVCHDETVDRVTDASGPVSAFSAAELAGLSVCGNGEGVPTLVSVLDAMPASTTLHVELKEVGLGNEVVDLASGADCPVVVSAFEPAALEGVGELPTSLIGVEGDGLVERAVSLGCKGVHPNHEACTADLVSRAHDAGLDVNAWTVTDPTETRQLREAGVDGVITDFPVCCLG